MTSLILRLSPIVPFHKSSVSMVRKSRVYVSTKPRFAGSWLYVREQQNAKPTFMRQGEPSCEMYLSKG